MSSALPSQDNDTNADAELNAELFDENREKPLSRFINQIISYKSIIPSSKELNEDLNKVFSNFSNLYY